MNINVLFGCFPPKLAETLGKPKAEGQKLFDSFWKANAPVKLLTESLEDEYASTGGKIRGLDGRWLYVRDKRKLLNTLLQNAAAAVFKQWMIQCDAYLSARDPVDIMQTIAYHDELQFESHATEEKTKEAGEAVCKLALESGRSFLLQVQTPAEMKIGKNWGDTH